MAGSIATFIGSSADNFSSLASALHMTTDEFASTIGTSSGDIAKYLSENEGNFSSVTQAMMKSAGEGIGNLGGGVATMLEGVSEAISSLHGEIGGSIKLSVADIGALLLKAIQEGGITEETFAEFKGKLDGSGNDESGLSSALSKISKGASQAGTGIQTLTSIGGALSNITLSDFASGGSSSVTTTPSSYGNGYSDYSDSSSNSDSSGSSGSDDSDTTKDNPMKDHIENEWDYLTDITNDMDRASAAMEKLSSLENRLYGTDKIANLQKLKASYKGYISLLEQELSLAKNQASIKRGQLAQYGASYDSEGNLQNGESITARLTQAVNNAIDNYNAHRNDDDTTYWEDAIDDAQDDLDNFTDLFNDYQDALSTQEEAQSQIQEYLQKIQDDTDEIVDSILDGVDTMKEAYESTIEFNKLFNDFTNGGSLADRLGNQLTHSVEGMASYFNKSVDRDNNGTLDSNLLDFGVDVLKDRIADFQDTFDIVGLNNNGTLITQDDGVDADHEKYSQEAAMDNLREAIDNVTDNIESAVDYYNELIDVLNDAIDGLNDLIDQRQEQYDNISDYLDTRLDQASLLYGEEGYSAQIALKQAKLQSDSGRIQTDQEGMRAQEQIIATLKDIQSQEGTLSEAQQEQLQSAQEKYTELQQDILDTETDSLKTLQEIKEAQVTQRTDELVNSLFGGTDIDWLDSQ